MNDPGYTMVSNEWLKRLGAVDARVTVRDVPSDATPRALDGRDVMMWRMSHGGANPPDFAVDAAAPVAEQLQGRDLWLYQMAHGGKGPGEGSAR